jgi:hypothetical protein
VAVRGQDVREVPADATCPCVKNHNPQTNKLLPWDMPRGQTIWVCPTTYYCLSELLALYKQLRGKPEARILMHYPLFTRRLIALYLEEQDRKRGKVSA